MEDKEKIIKNILTTKGSEFLSDDFDLGSMLSYLNVWKLIIQKYTKKPNVPKIVIDSNAFYNCIISKNLKKEAVSLKVLRAFSHDGFNVKVINEKQFYISIEPTKLKKILLGFIDYDDYEPKTLVLKK